ncbi:MAG: hypothetical protein AAFS07_11290 [Pseudomonadota bacterium]
MTLDISKGLLIEYGITLPPLVLQFQFNPETLSRTRAIELNLGTAPGANRGYDFLSPTDTPRVAQGVQVQAEEFSLDILLDATERAADGSPVAAVQGIEPQLDMLRTMVEPKIQGPNGVSTLASLGLGGERAFQRNETASVLLLVWGLRVLPVFLTSVQVEEVAHLPTLIPYRANVTLSFTVIEGNNPFYLAEKWRQSASAAISVADSIATTVVSSFRGGA